MGSVRPTAWRLATQWRGASGLQWGAVRRLWAKWKKNSRALWVDLLLLTTGELQAEVQAQLQGAPVLVAGGLTVRDEAAPIPQHTHDPPAGGGCSRPVGGATQLGERRLYRGSADDNATGTLHTMSSGWDYTKWGAFAGTGHRKTSALAMITTTYTGYYVSALAFMPTICPGYDTN